jgi:hypothetical protein
MLSNTYLRERAWQKRLPVQGCPDCYRGTVRQVDYDDIQCSTCNGKGTIDSKKKVLSMDKVLLQINNTSKSK